MKTPFAEGPAEEPPRAGSRLRSVGELLRERREELDLDLDSIGAVLRIRPSYLAALEQDRSHELPGVAYAMGFIRAYAHHLGLDADAVLSRFKDESAGLTARPDLSLPVPLGERSLPGAAMLLIALILVLCGYGTWYYLSTGERSRPERVTAVPPALQPNLPVPPAAANPGTGIILTPGGLGAPLTGGEPVAAAPATPPSSGPATPPPAAASPNAGPPAPAPAASPPPANPAAAVTGQVTIKAVADCWIQVRGADNAIVFSRVLKAGEVYKVPEKTGLFLRTGNAGALQIAIDGKPAPSIGTTGTMRRNVALDPGELSAGTAVHG